MNYDYIIGGIAALGLLYIGFKSDKPETSDSKINRIKLDIESIDKEIKIHQDHIDVLEKSEDDDEKSKSKIETLKSKISGLTDTKNKLALKID